MTYLVRWFRFVAALTLLVGNLLFCSSVVLLACPISWLPLLGESWLNKVKITMQRMHATNITAILRSVSGVTLKLCGEMDVSENGKYIVIANHQSGLDVAVLLSVFWGRLPPLMFFLKRSLAYVPIVGWFSYIMGYPFIDRVESGASLKDAKRILDAQRVRLASQCEWVFKQASALVVFVEGTRFSSTKRSSAYRYVLQPQSTGLAICLANLPDDFTSVVDVTLFYKGVQPVTLWSVLNGTCRFIEVHVQLHACEEFVRQDCVTDRSKRRPLTQWLQATWVEKDALLTSLHDESCT